MFKLSYYDDYEEDFKNHQDIIKKEYSSIKKAIEAAEKTKLPLYWFRISEWDEDNDEFIGTCNLEVAKANDLERLDF